MQEPITPHRWSNTTKLVVALSFAALLVLMAIRFQYLISPLIAAGVLAYIFQPFALFLSRKLKISNRFAVAIVYIFFVLLILGLLIWGGIAITGQLSGLIGYLSKNIATWPVTISTFLSTPFKIGSSTINLNTVDLAQFNTQVIQYIQQILASVGTAVANLGKSAMSVVGWTFFSILISYFILSELEAGKKRLQNIGFLGQGEDQNKIGRALDTIWNTYLRRQFLIFIITLVIYSALLAVLNVNYFFGLALLAAFARFIPYLGPLITWIVFALVAGFASNPIFGMSPLVYAIFVVVIIYLVDTFFDLFVFTKLMASALKMHPAAIMVAALVGLNLFGIVGVVLAAPILATLILLFKYAQYKMIDLDPWVQLSLIPIERESPKWIKWISKIVTRVKDFNKKLFSKLFKRRETIKNTTKGVKDGSNPGTKDNHIRGN